MNSYNIAAIPTEYRGQTYRSRLEAKWAAFFDIIDWRADYEPNDWNGYIPDFRVGHTYFEVKPFRDYDEPAANKARTAIRFGPDNAEVRRFILLKDAPSYLEVNPFCRSIGWILNSESSEESKQDECLLVPAMTADETGLPQLRYYIATWGGSHTLDPLLPNTAFGLGHVIDQRWNQAGAATQWKASA